LRSCSRRSSTGPVRAKWAGEEWSVRGVDAAARRARRADSMIFALNALLFAAWTPHIPAIKDRLGLHEGTLGLARLGAPVGALLAVIVVGPALARWGSVRVLRLTMIGFALAGPLVGLADSLPALFGALMIFGAFQGSM